MALFAKITPKRVGVEGTVFAFLTGTSNFDQAVLQPMIGAWINYQFVGVNKDDQSGYPTLCLITLCLAPIGFALVFLIPKKEDIDKANIERQEEEREEIKKSMSRQ